MFFAECAKRLNPEGWKPDWSNGEEFKWFIGYDHDDKEYHVSSDWFLENVGIVYFATREIAEQAIKEAKKYHKEFANLNDFENEREL